MFLASTRTRTANPWIAPLGAAALAMVLAQFGSWVSPLLIALVLGTVLANTLSVERRERLTDPAVVKLMLRLGIVLIGFRLSLSHLVDIGFRGVLIALATVGITYVSTRALGRRLGVDEGLTQLLAAGVSICGAAAIASVQDAVRASKRDVGIALALITVFGTMMIGIIPVLADAFGLSDQEAGIWAGASIHEVAQVVAAGSLIGTGALAVAVSVKLTRVMLLAPVHALASRSSRDENTAPASLLPWYVAGFLVAVAIRSTGVLPSQALSLLDSGASLMLSAAMFGLGLGIAARDLWPLPWRAALLATGGTCIVTAVPLALLHLTR